MYLHTHTPRSVAREFLEFASSIGVEHAEALCFVFLRWDSLPLNHHPLQLNGIPNHPKAPYSKGMSLVSMWGSGGGKWEPFLPLR